uniref:Uncharacterized protein n=2 Tax=Macaca TaxID=9539 RepID=A0A5F8A3B8_MACMU
YSCLSLPSSWDYKRATTTWLSFVCLEETGLHHVGQAGLKLLTSSDPPDSASQSAGITGVSLGAWPSSSYFEVYKKLFLTILTLLCYHTLELIPSNCMFVLINQSVFTPPCTFPGFW